MYKKYQGRKFKPSELLEMAIARKLSRTRLRLYKKGEGYCALGAMARMLGISCEVLSCSYSNLSSIPDEEMDVGGTIPCLLERPQAAAVDLMPSALPLGGDLIRVASSVEEVVMRLNDGGVPWEDIVVVLKAQGC